MHNNPFDNYTDEYEKWFKENSSFFQSELLALKQVIPTDKKGVEIGVGSGLFANKLGIQFGIDPSENMLKYAKQRNITIEKGVAENLPYDDNSFDFAVFITSICFIKDPSKALMEASRVIKESGNLIVAFINRDSTLGQTLLAEKQDSKFYKNATFYSADEIISLIEESHFRVTHTFQTLTDLQKREVEEPSQGFDKGSFIVIRAEKR